MLPVNILLPTKHPDLEAVWDEMLKWRYCFAGGNIFKERFLEKISVDELDADFVKRKRLTPVGAFAAEGICEIRDEIYQHFPMIRRQGGPKSYQEAISGQNGGVDLCGNCMDSYMGEKILLELLLMGKVGLFIDMPKTSEKGNLLSENQNRRPYVYMYTREQILNWVPDTSSENNEFKAVWLQDDQYEYDEYGFPSNAICRQRRIFRENGAVFEQIWDKEHGFQGSTPRKLGIKRVPFVLFEINDSLMRRVADHQIAHLNIESLDINFLINSNFATYLEEAEPLMPGQPATARTIKVGTTKGRQYPKGFQPPQYVNPSSETMKASIDKQEQLKIDIRRLLSLAISQIKQQTGDKAQGNINPQTSETSGTKSGFAAIGLTMQLGEQKTASYWAEWEHGVSKGDSSPITIAYPTAYDSKSTAQRIVEAKSYTELTDKTPSKTGQKEINKAAIRTLLEGKVDEKTLATIDKEIDAATIIQIDATTIASDVQGGLVDPETASIARGYPKEASQKAEDYQARRAAAIVVSQTQGHAANAPSGNLKNPAARGAPELAPNSDKNAQKSGEKQQAKQQKKQQVNPGGQKADSKGNNA